MKKTILIGLSALVISLSLTGQTAEKFDLNLPKSSRKAAGLGNGDNTINLYYGVSIFNSLYKSAVANSAVGVGYSSLGPLGIVYEHMMTDKVGLGAEIGYSKFSATYSEQDTDPNGNIYTAHASLDWTVFRAQLRLNIHFVQNEKFDCYFLLSAGYKKTSFGVKYDDSYQHNNISYTLPIPIGIKPGIGIRYFFIENLGLNVEIAIGNPVMCGGLSFKF